MAAATLIGHSSLEGSSHPPPEVPDSLNAALPVQVTDVTLGPSHRLRPLSATNVHHEGDQMTAWVARMLGRLTTRQESLRPQSVPSGRSNTGHIN